MRGVGADYITLDLRMSLGARTSYALRLLVVFTAAVMLALSIAEGVGVRLGFDVGTLVTHPAYLLPCFVLAWLVAPVISRRVPQTRVAHNSRIDGASVPRWAIYALAALALLISGYSLIRGA